MKKDKRAKRERPPADRQEQLWYTLIAIEHLCRQTRRHLFPKEGEQRGA